MLANGLRRAYIVWDRKLNAPRASHPLFQPIADHFATINGGSDYREHEGVFLEVGAITNSLFGAFVHKTCRGPAAGGLRMMKYNTLEAFLHDGVRLSNGMTRKNALAGIWWGGGKGIIPVLDATQARSRPFRDIVFQEYGSFVSSLNGCYYTAEDLGTNVVDMDQVYKKTRFMTCISEHLGGKGNPSSKTGRGIVCGMEAALDYFGRGPIAGKRIAVQGCGNVATAMVARLVELGVGEVVAADVNPDSVARFNANKKWENKKVRAHVVRPGDMSILFDECDVVAPCATGGILNPTTIPRIKAKIICGAANNQLLDEKRDIAALRARGIRYAPDYLVNRMGVVDCMAEPFGKMTKDPLIQHHYTREAEDGIFQVLQRVFAHADRHGITEVEAANKLADEAAQVLNPLWGHRGQQIVDDLVASRWERRMPLSDSF